MPLYDISHRYSGKVLFRLETSSFKQTLEAGVKIKADLTGAILTGADLRGATLWDATLRGADLRGANLRGADLIPIRDDLWAVLSAAPTEVAGLRRALMEGRINGSAYRGACACLIGTLANVRGCEYEALPYLQPNSARPAERWFLHIKEGDTPENSPVAQHTVEWIDLWLHNMQAAFGAQPTQP